MALPSTQFVPADLASTSSESGPLLSIRSVAKRFGNTQVLHDVCLNVAPGEFLTILGASGSGKTTLLRLVAGFEQPDAGEIWMAGERLDLLPPYRRHVNTVFQNYALFPHLSVFENVAYGMRVQKAPRAEISDRVQQALALVKMSGFARRAPSQLSGGQQQRIALARALVNRPKLLLLDEPLSALDANLRGQMQIELKSLQREVGISFVFVTHDQAEALALSDRIALLRAGQLEQVAGPREIYTHPATTYVAQFIGKTNLLQGNAQNGMAHYGILTWPCEGADGPATFSLRPETVRIVSNPAQPCARDSVRFRASIRNRVYGGDREMLEIVCRDGRSFLLSVQGSANIEGEREFEFSSADAVRLQE